MSETLAPYCSGGCGRQIDDDDNPYDNPWLAILGERVKTATELRDELRSPVTLFLCPECEQRGDALPRIQEFVFDTELVRLPDNTPRAVLGLIRT